MRGEDVSRSPVEPLCLVPASKILGTWAAERADTLRCVKDLILRVSSWDWGTWCSCIRYFPLAAKPPVRS